MSHAFPSMLEYQEAIQNPGSCFQDPELESSSVVLDPLGLPKPITGGFASVYQVQTKKHYAIRCFLRSHAGVQDRYARISEFQRLHRPKWMAEFVYLPQGIKVRGKWFPVLKMEWVQGEQLNTHVGKLVGNKKALRSLADKFLALLEAMKKHGVAHGDLQHGNVLVSGGELKLIDYDAMFIPGMSGQSHEVGHRNFQHPKREGRHFDGDLDHFSAWVILISLRALALAPQLWKTLDAGDEGLLFSKEDFLSPQTSKAFAEIEKIADASLRQDLDYLRQSLAADPSRVLSPAAKPATAKTSPKLTAAAAPSAAKTSAVAPKATSQLSGVSAGAHSKLSPRVVGERLMLLVTILGCTGLGLAFWQQKITQDLALSGGVALLTIAMTFLRLRFVGLPPVKERARLRKELQEAHSGLAQSEERLQGLSEIEAHLKQARWSDFDQLADKVSGREGRLLLESFRVHLQGQKWADAQAAGFDAELVRRLRRAGLKHALALQDILVSRSMSEGEQNEQFTILLVSGKGLHEPAITRAVAEKLLAWRTQLEKEFLKETSDREQAHHAAVQRCVQDLQGSLSQYDDVTGWRFLGVICGFS